MTRRTPFRHPTEKLIPGMNVAPKWMADWAAFLVRSLNLEYVDLLIETRPDPGDDTNNLGFTLYDWAYIRANIAIRSDVADSRFGRATILHEFYHVVLYRYNQAAELLINMIPDMDRDFAGKIWRDANESTVEQMARDNLDRLLAEYKVDRRRRRKGNKQDGSSGE